MRVLWSWLKELVEIDLDPEALAERLDIAGIEVDEIERSGPQFTGVVTARILEIRPHPDAQKLSLCVVTDGTEERTVVCGAANMKVGDGVALAKHKARLPGGHVIKRGKIRGEKSDGMLCSEIELHIGDDADGILILPGDQPLGVPLQQQLGLDDCVLVLDLTPDRADCLGMVGVAREIAALTGAALKGPARIPQWWTPAEPGPATAVAGAGDHAVEIALQDTDGCPRYTGIVVRGVQIGPSPAWLTRRLEAAGAGVHNNVVDATNYLARLLGQPFHAFDLRFLRGQQVIIRRGHDGEVFRALDGSDHLLTTDDVAICDAEGVVALGGVIGGEGSMVLDDTTDLLLEAAYFTPAFIRATSGRTGVKTESSDRFARGIDAAGALVANRMLAELIVELAGGEIVEPVADCAPRPWTPRPVTLRQSRIRGLLGADVPRDEAVALLEQDGLRVEDRGDVLEVCGPPWRVDIEQEVDLIEEIARLWGYDRIPITMPVAEREPVSRSDGQEREARWVMAGLGFHELNLLSFCGRDELEDLGYSEEELARCVELDNPLGVDSALLQPSLLPGMIRHAGAASRRFSDLRTFQLRRTFVLGGGETGVAETLSLAALWMGRRQPPGWGQDDAEADFYDLRGALEQLLEHFRVGGIRMEPFSTPPAYLDPGQAAVLTRGRDRVGLIGRLSAAVIQRHELAGPATVFEIPFDRLVRGQPRMRYKAPSEYPASERDVALLVRAGVGAQALLDEIGRAKPAHLVRSDVFDVYEGPELPEGVRSVALRMVFQSADGTLEGRVVDEAFGRVLHRFRALEGVTVREG